MLKYSEDHLADHHGLCSYVNPKDKCSIFCRFTCSLLSSWCFFSFPCDWVDVARCRICCDCQSRLTHRGAGTSLAPHLVVQGTASLDQKILGEVARREIQNQIFLFHFRLLQLCFGDFFSPIYSSFLWIFTSSALGNVLSLSCRACICETQGQVQSYSLCGWGVR